MLFSKQSQTFIKHKYTSYVRTISHNVRKYKSFYTFINTPINQRNSLFYSNLQEKKLSKTNSIEGFVKEVSKDGKSVTFKPVTNKKENIITYTCKINQNGVQTILQENSTNNIFSLPLSSYGVMNIQVYLNGTEYCNFDYTFNTQWIK